MKHIPVMFVLIIRPDTLRPVFLRNLGIELRSTHNSWGDPQFRRKAAIFGGSP